MKYADRTRFIKVSEIRELLKLTENPEIISFGGGMPSPKAFPINFIQKSVRKILKDKGPQALQYGPTEGITPLRQAIIDRMARKRSIKCNLNQIMVTTGSQQALDLSSKLLINPGDYIIVECPTYTGALTAFNVYQDKYIPVHMDEDGMKTQELEDTLKANKDKNIKFIYTIPAFQNPSGVTMSNERRKHLLEISQKYDIPILEDEAYSELVYEGDVPLPIKSMDKNDSVIYTHTFSKFLSPGFRLGWVVGSEEFIGKMAIEKQGADLCTNMLVQFIAEDYLKSDLIEKQIAKTRKMYRKKRDIMIDALEEHFPSGSEWSCPKGGMFIWVALPNGIDTKEMFKDALKEKVAYVYGSAFCVDNCGNNCMRLNFSNADDDRIEEGIKRLSKVIRGRLL
jgi:2-aminoadipate transaminase